MNVAEHCNFWFDREMFKEKGSKCSNTFVLLKEILQEKSSSSEKKPIFNTPILFLQYLNVADYCYFWFDREIFKEKGSKCSNAFVLLKEILQEKSSSSGKKRLAFIRLYFAINI